jgi:quinol monooxygenase YgiN
MRQHILQQSTELLVVTLAHVLPGKEREARIHIRTIAETLQSATGLVSTHIYRGRDNGIAYLFLTTWEDEESWIKAQERHTPKGLLLLAQDILTAAPEQWLMYYIWGWTRPTMPSQLAAVHLITVAPQVIQTTQTSWLAGLRQPDLQSLLTFAFLARGINDTATTATIATTPRTEDYREILKLQSSLLLSFLSWSNEVEREEFYADPGYQNIKSMAEREGSMRSITLEPV